MVSLTLNLIRAGLSSVVLGNLQQDLIRLVIDFQDSAL